MPLKASDAMRGSPSPWKVLAIMPRQARDRDRRLKVSVKDSSEDTDIVGGALRVGGPRGVEVEEIRMRVETRLRSHEFETKIIAERLN